VGEFVDQGDLRGAREHGLEVEFGQGDASVLIDPARYFRQSDGLRLGGGAIVGFDDRDDDVVTLLAEAAAFGEHLERLADARGSAQEHAEASASRLLRSRTLRPLCAHSPSRSSDAGFRSATSMCSSPRNPRSRP